MYIERNKLKFLPISVAARCKACRLRSLACWDCGFESRRGHGCLPVWSVVCCQVEVSSTGLSLVQRSLPTVMRRCVWSRNLKNDEALARVGSTVARLLGLWVPIPTGAWMSVCVECCVFSGRGIFDKLITRPEKPTDGDASLCLI